MSRMRLDGPQILISAAALCGACLSSGAAQAAPAGSLLPEQHFAAFKGICLDHVGNAKAQVAAAIAAPHLLREIDPSADGTRRFDGVDYTASVLDNGDQRYCMVSAIVAETANLAPGIAAANPHLKQGAIGQAHDSQTYVWAVTAAAEPTLYVYYIGKKDGVMLASFGVGVEKSR